MSITVNKIYDILQEVSHVKLITDQGSEHELYYVENLYDDGWSLKSDILDYASSNKYEIIQETVLLIEKDEEIVRIEEI